MRRLLQRLLDINGIGKNHQMAHQEITLFQISELMKISKTFKLPSQVKKIFKDILGPQSKMLTDIGLYQRLLITHHMLIIQINILTTMVWFN